MAVGTRSDPLERTLNASSSRKSYLNFIAGAPDWFLWTQKEMEYAARRLLIAGRPQRIGSLASQQPYIPLLLSVGTQLTVIISRLLPQSQKTSVLRVTNREK